jgi:hypothetical protein
MAVTGMARTIAMICAGLQWWPDARPLRNSYAITLVRSRANSCDDPKFQVALLLGFNANSPGMRAGR